jgi:predicted MFS family arabinose efflux permease
MFSVRLRVFTCFTLGYFMSYLFRGVNIGFAPFITRDLGLDAGDLGLLTSLYFLGFAALQIPGGMLLDRFGARRSEAAFLLVAAAGILLFGQAHGLGAMMAGRLLIGAGVSLCFGGACKAIANHFPAEQLPLLYGLVLGLGGVGGILVGTPLASLLHVVTWRTACTGLALLTVGSAALLMVGTPESPAPAGGVGLAAQLRGTRDVFTSAFFWRVAPFSALTQGVFYAAQSLWVGAYLRDVQGMEAAPAAAIVSAIGLAMVVGSIAFGAAARALERRGVSVLAFSGIGMGLFVAVQVMLVAGVPLPPLVLWLGYGLFGGTGILTYSVLAAAVPRALVGRVSTALNLLLFSAIFALQWGIGAAVGLWPKQAGHPPADAHRIVWGVLALAQLVAALPYLRRRRTRPAGVSALQS